MDFETRFDKLNDNQKAAVKAIHGPLLVVAGPGTGKTELLSMRSAQILRQTDTLASSILCLTFTESAATNMRERLREIIGEEAYKVAIHTFHSFGVEIINQNREYFFRGSEFKPADELAQYQIMRQLFDALDWQHPLATKNGEDYVYLSDVTSIISEFKKSGLSVDELRNIIADNKSVIDQVEADVTEIFASKITKDTIAKFAPLAEKVAAIEQSELPAGISSYASVLALSIVHALQEATELGKTTPITAWKRAWCKQDAQKNHVLKDGLYIDKLLAAVDLYESYKQALTEANLYDYDDMILNVIRAVESHADLAANLQEQFQYIMVDEFQDTNLAQLRLLFGLTDSDSPNVMAVGDDDQAIFSFQGADIGNIQRFRERFSDPKIIVLTDNYRSAPEVLTASRSIITQGVDRLENTIPDLSKELTPWFHDSGAKVSLHEYISPDTEKSALAGEISKLINSGTPAESIAVIARQHNELIDLLPYLSREGILVNYERRDNALENDIVVLIEKLTRVVIATANSDHSAANALLPELVAHPAFGFTPHDIWSLSLAAWRNRSLWLEAMQTHSAFKPFADWIIQQSVNSSQLSFEQQIDELVGKTSTESPAQSSHPNDDDEDTPNESYRQSSNLSADTVKRLQPEYVPIPGAEGGISANGYESGDSELKNHYRSPLYSYFFSSDKLANQPDLYLSALEALRTIRDQLREHVDDRQPTLADLLSLIDLYRQLGTRLTVVRSRADHQAGHINLMTAHKSKGLEFDHVYITGAIDNRWGEKVRSRSRNIPYPANLPLEPLGGSYDERLRLFFVAMTRAKKTLTMSFASQDNKGKPTLVASFLSQHEITEHAPSTDIRSLVDNIETDWRGQVAGPVTNDLKTLLAPVLESYKLSITHLNNFIDVASGGPQNFLLSNLLRFPQSKSPHAGYGTAVHAALQNAHNAVRVDGKLPNQESILDDFTEQLKAQHLEDEDFANFNEKGRQSLAAFLSAKAGTFTASQATELSFAGQGVVIGDARLTGNLDLVDIDSQEKTIKVTDYKTGRASRDWKGKADYEKIKLHKYRQQLMFYQLMAENSRDYSGYTFTGGVLQFVEPDQATGEILALEDTFSSEELDHFKQLITVIWRKIINLDLPDVSGYEPSYKGMVQFEQDLLEDRL